GASRRIGDASSASRGQGQPRIGAHACGGILLDNQIPAAIPGATPPALPLAVFTDEFPGKSK
ncbi:hypothetical protein SB749_19295, partial [Brevibacterium sp. SIMBA_078]|uniref:hypothetical protein n=1 Tax=Brevibacterium sp. SIMBA_078 TaxID=3085816 RepID=UPI00397D2472